MQGFGQENNLQQIQSGETCDIKVGEYVTFLQSSHDSEIWYSDDIAPQILAVSTKDGLDYEIAPGVNTL